MKKIIILLVVICIAIAATIYAATDIYIKSSNVITVGWDDVKLDNDTYIINDKLYVPVRELFEKMNVPVLWNEDKNQVELMTQFKEIQTSQMTDFKDEGVIPDAETAYQVGKIILEKYVGKPLEYETEVGTYYLNVVYYELSNGWRVSQECRLKKELGGGGENIAHFVLLNKNTGEVMYLSKYSALFDALESGEFWRQNIVNGEMEE